MATDNSLLMWAKSIAPHAEEGAVGAAALVPGVNQELRAAERGMAEFGVDSHSRKGKTNTSQYAGDREVQSSPGEKRSPGRWSCF